MINDVVSKLNPVSLAVSPEAFAMVSAVLTKNNIPFEVVNTDLQK